MKNLNWTVEKQQLVTTSNILTDSFAVVRTDNNSVLGVVKEGYHLHQNSEKLEILTKIAGDNNWKLGNTFCIKGGKRVAIQIEIEPANIGDDTVKRFLTVLDSHDGSTSLSFGYSNTVMSCQNQFYKFYKSNEVRIRHTKSMSFKIENVIKGLLQAKELENESLKVFTNWVSTPVSKELATDMILSQLDIDSIADMSKLSINKQIQVDSLRDVVKSEMAYKGQNKWGLFNGFTYYANHKMDKETLVDGKAYDFNMKAFEALSLA